MELVPTMGSAARIFSSRETASDNFRPILEVRDVRRLAPTGAQECINRIMVIMSDGAFTFQGVFGLGPIHDQINEGRIGMHSLLRLQEWHLVETPAKRSHPDSEGAEKTPKVVLCVATAEAVGILAQERRVPEEQLRPWDRSRGAGSVLDSQAAPQQGGGFGMPQYHHAAPGGLAAEDQSIFGGAPAAPAAHNPYSSGAGTVAAAPGGQAYGFTAASGAGSEGGGLAPMGGGNLYATGAAAAASGPYGLSAQGNEPPHKMQRTGAPQSAGSSFGGSGAPPLQGYGGTTAPAQSYGGPTTPAQSYGGAPGSAQDHGSAPVQAQPAQSFGGATGPAQGYGGSAPAQGYGGTASPAQSFGGATGPAQGYGGSAPAQGYGGTAPPAQSFGGATASAQGYGGPSAPAQGFGGAAPQAQPFGGASAPAPGGAARAPGLAGFGFAPQSLQHHQPTQQQQPPGFGQSPGMGRGAPGAFRATQGPAGGNVMPIASLSPYAGGRWKIKARVTHKSDIRKFNNARGEGQLFKIDLIDKDGAEISGTFFGRAVDRFFEMLRPQQVYYFSRGSVKMANKRFDKGEHVITFDENTSIDPADEDQEIPGVKYNFVALADVDQQEVGSTIDVKAVILEARDPFTVMLRKNNEERLKRELVLWDDSGPDGSSFIELTIWGQNCNDNFEAGAVLFAKGVRVSEWSSVKSLNGSSGYELNPDNPESITMRRKFDEKRPNQGAAGNPARASKMTGARETIEEIQQADMHLGPPREPGQGFDTTPGAPKSVLRHFMLGTLSNMPSDRPPFYQACPEQVDARPGQNGEVQKRSCNKKMSQNGDMWFCQAGHSCAKPMARYLANRVQVVDHTGSLEVSFFDEAGRQIFGCEANEIAELWDDPSRDQELQQRLSQLTWKRFLFRVTSKNESWQDELRVRRQAEEGATPNLVKEGNRMLAEVKAALQTPAPEQDALTR